MDHGGEAARATTVGSTDLSMAGAVQGGEVVHLTADTFHGQLGAAVARSASFEPTAAAYLLSSAEFARHVRGALPVAVFHREPGPGVAHVNSDMFWGQPGPAGVLLVRPQLLVQVHDNYYGYFAMQHRPGAGLGVDVVLADLHPDGIGVVYSGDYGLHPRPARAGHGDVFADLLAGGDTVHDDYDYYPLQHHPGAGRGELVGVVFDNSGNFARQTLPSTGDLGAAYEAPGMAAEHLRRRLLAFAGIGACSVAVNGLAAGPGSPAVALRLFVLLLGGLFLVILHMLRV